MNTEFSEEEIPKNIKQWEGCYNYSILAWFDILEEKQNN